MTLNVVVKLKIMPVSVDTDMEKITGDIRPIVEKLGEVNKTETVPVAFGLNAIEATILLDDSKGGIESIEEEIKALEDVLEVEVLGVDRL